jgi:hypothetical protein
VARIEKFFEDNRDNIDFDLSLVVYDVNVDGAKATKLCAVIDGTYVHTPVNLIMPMPFDDDDDDDG